MTPIMPAFAWNVNIVTILSRGMRLIKRSRCTTQLCLPVARSQQSLLPGVCFPDVFRRSRAATVRGVLDTLCCKRLPTPCICAIMETGFESGNELTGRY